MAKLFIPFKVNDRKSITLEFSDENCEQKEIVCSMSETGFTKLLYFPTKLHAASDLTQKHDLDVSLQAINYSVPETMEDEVATEENIELIFTREVPTPTSPQKPVKKNAVQEPEATPKWEVGKMCCEQGYEEEEKIDKNTNKKTKEKIEVWELKRQYADSYRRINITLVIENEQNGGKSKLRYKTKLICHLIPKTDCYEIVLDFGSEASQMSIKNKGVTHIPILEKAKNLLPEYEAYRKVETKDFHQYVEGNSNLFQSIFYLDENDHPLFLSKVKDDDEYKKLKLIPSLKIAMLSSNTEDTDNLLRYYRQIICDFLRTAIATIADKKNLPDHVGLQLKLLMPNVMNIGDVNTFINEILTGFRVLRDHNPELSGTFYLEITPYSESDTSFLGYFQNSIGEQQINKEEHYLIIDGGKGTMDFSIMSPLGGKNFKSCYRNGFVGSGNAITYAIFDHLCAIIKGSPENERRKTLMQDILFNSENDQVGMKKLLDVLEKIKKVYSNTPSDKIEKNCERLFSLFEGQNLKQLTAAGLASQLEDQKLIGSFGDKYGIIHATCCNICATLVYNLKRNNIATPQQNEKPTEKEADIFFQKVILAGRAFKFDMLKEELKRVLKAEFDYSEELIYMEKAKEACIDGAFAWTSINGDSRVSGIPCKGILVKDNQNMPKQSNTNPFNFLFGDEKPKEKRSNQTIKNFKIDRNFLMNGFDIPLDANEYLYINSNLAEIQDSQRNNQKRTYNLYYTEKGLLLRNEQNVETPKLNKLLKETNVAESLIFASRFPRYDNEDDKANLSLWELPVL